VSSTSERNYPEAICETDGKVAVDVPVFAQAGQEQHGRAMATPINHLELNMFSGQTGYGNEPNVL
jgi:hypothetical protein